MLMEKERDKIVAYSKKLVESNLTKGTSGNISIFNKELGYIAITPSGMDYNEINIEDVVIIDLDKNVIEGDKKASSECDLHIAMYRKKEDMRAVVHTHSMYCTILACTGQKLKAIHYVLADAGVAEVPLAPYTTYGTKELADVVSEAIGDSDACLMANHGMIAGGESIEQAFSLATTCEWVAEIQWKAMCIGNPNYLDSQEILKVKNKFKSYGQTDTSTGSGYFG